MAVDEGKTSVSQVEEKVSKNIALQIFLQAACH